MANHRTKLTKELITEFCGRIEKGVPADTVCDFHGITNSTYWMWMRKGALFLEDEGESKALKKLKIYGLFVSEYRKAVALYKIEMVKRLHSGKGNNWVRDLAILERRDPNSFGRTPTGSMSDDHDPDDTFL